jgi:hypothetical protein
MPRNATGTYTLVAGNPVTTGAVIESEWANNTMADLASEMTDSLSRTGDGGMEVPLKGVTGTPTNPTYTFTNFPNSGIYAATGTDVRLSIAGMDRMRWLAGGNTAQIWNVADNAWRDIMYGGVPIEAIDGTLVLPAYSFASDPTTGMYLAGTDDLRMSVGGVDRMRWLDGGNVAQIWNVAGAEWIDLIFFTDPAVLQGVDGTVTTPAYSYANDTDTGLYLAAAGDTRMAVGGVDTMRWIDGGNTPQIWNVSAAEWRDVLFFDDPAPLQGVDGTVSAPAYSFASATDSGLYQTGSNTVMAAGGADSMRWRDGLIAQIWDGGLWKDISVVPPNPVVDGVPFTASGALTDGSSVILNPDGTVSVVAGTKRGNLSQEEISVLTYNDYGNAAYDPVKNVVLVIIRNWNNADYWIHVGVVTGSAIAFGVGVALPHGASSIYGMSIEYHVAEGNFLAAWMNSSSLEAVAISTSGNVPTTGTKVATASSTFQSTGVIDLAYNSDFDNMAVLASRTTNYACDMMVINVSGLVVTLGPKVSMGSSVGAPTVRKGLCYNPVAGQYFLAYNATSQTQGIVAIGNATTITSNGGNAGLLSGANGNADCIYIPEIDLIVACNMDRTAGFFTNFIAVTLAGAPTNSYTLGPIFTSTMKHADNSASIHNRMVVGDGDGAFYVPAGLNEAGSTGSVRSAYTKMRCSAGGVITQEETVDFFNNSSNESKALIQFPTGDIGVLWSENGVNLPEFSMTNYGSTNVTAENFLGFSDGDYADAQEALIMTFSRTSDAQTGLTVNGEYYVQEDGTLDTAPNPLASVFAGRAVSTTNIVVKEPSA